MSDSVDYSSQYNSLVSQYNNLVRMKAQLTAEVRQAQSDAMTCTELLSELRAYVQPPLEILDGQLFERVEHTREVLMLLSELRDAYLNIKNVSVSTAMLTGCQDRHFTYFGDFNDLRRVSLGYVVGLDTNLWKTDAPRKKVEKVYLANTDYWLAYATMSVMLWASDQKEAADFAISKAMQMNPQKASLFYLIVNLRFERVEVAKQWFRIYFDLLRPEDISKEIQYLIQAVLCGAFGRDREFERQCIDTIMRLFEESKASYGFLDRINNEIMRHFALCVSVSGKDYVSLSRACPEYKDMMSLMSQAERNSKLRDYFAATINAKVVLEDTLYSRIEQVLYHLIESYDEKEKELLDEMEYHQIMVQSKGNKEIAESVYQNRRAQERMEADLSLLLVRLALDYDSDTNPTVKKFALNTVKGYVQECASRLPNEYRGREKAKYPFKIDNWQENGSENDLESMSRSLKRHDEQIVKHKIKQDKVYKGTKIAGILALIAFLIAGGVTAGMFVSSGVISLIAVLCTLVFLTVFILMMVFNNTQKTKIKKANDYIIQKNQSLLKAAVADLAKWRADYKREDAVNQELVQLFSLAITGGENHVN